jgi:hypothetical protein
MQHWVTNTASLAVSLSLLYCAVGLMRAVMWMDATLGSLLQAPIGGSLNVQLHIPHHCKFSISHMTEAAGNRSICQQGTHKLGHQRAQKVKVFWRSS